MIPRFQVPFAGDAPSNSLRRHLRHPAVAAVQLRGAAVADVTACRALSAAIHSETPGLPPFVVASPHGAAAGGPPEPLLPPDPQHLALDLAAGGEDLEVTLKVMTWGRRIAELGVDLVISPWFDRSLEPLSDPDLAGRLMAAWTEALTAAGLVACAGPVSSSDATDDDLWTPFGQALAHGLESLRLADELAADDRALCRTVEEVRERDDGLVVVGPTVSDAGQARASFEAGVDLVPLAASLAPEEIDAVLGEFDGVSSAPAGRVDSLREDWLV